MRTPSNTVVRLQGTGTWTENAWTGSFFGISWQVQINTTGTISVGSTVALTESGSLTYTAGTFTWGAGYNLWMTNGAALYGLGSYGVIIDNLIHPTNGPVSGILTGAHVYFYDTVPIKFGTISLVNSVANNAWQHLGTIGWTCNSLSCFLNSGSGNTGLRLTVGAQYTVNTSLIMLSWTSANNFGVAPNSFGTSKFTLAYGAYQDLYYLNSGANVSLIVDSSDGQTIWTRGGSLLGSINWKNWDYPRTRHSTFVSN